MSLFYLVDFMTQLAGDVSTPLCSVFYHFPPKKTCLNVLATLRGASMTRQHVLRRFRRPARPANTCWEHFRRPARPANTCWEHFRKLARPANTCWEHFRRLARPANTCWEHFRRLGRPHNTCFSKNIYTFSGKDSFFSTLVRHFKSYKKERQRKEQTSQLKYHEKWQQVSSLFPHNV